MPPPYTFTPSSRSSGFGTVGGGGGSPAFNVSPGPRAGQGAFGAVPGAIGLPSPYSDISAVYPNLSGTNQQVSNVLSSELGGQLSPDTVNALRNAAATFGISSGMGPGSGLANNKFFANIAGFSENRQHQGLQDYTSILPTVSRTQTVSPELQAQIAETNAINAAAPDPALAEAEQQKLFDKYFNLSRGAAGGSGGVPWYQQGYAALYNQTPVERILAPAGR